MEPLWLDTPRFWLNGTCSPKDVSGAAAQLLSDSNPSPVRSQG